MTIPVLTMFHEHLGFLPLHASAPVFTLTTIDMSEVVVPHAQQQHRPPANLTNRKSHRALLSAIFLMSETLCPASNTAATPARVIQQHDPPCRDGFRRGGATGDGFPVGMTPVTD
jgi:hypothetical protein